VIFSLTVGELSTVEGNALCELTVGNPSNRKEGHQKIVTNRTNKYPKKRERTQYLMRFDNLPTSSE